jgi:hypothetical protein
MTDEGDADIDVTFPIRSEATFRSTASDAVFRNRSEEGVKFWTFVGIRNSSWTCRRQATWTTARSYTSDGAMPCVLLNIYLAKENRGTRVAHTEHGIKVSRQCMSGPITGTLWLHGENQKTLTKTETPGIAGVNTAEDLIFNNLMRGVQSP